VAGYGTDADLDVIRAWWSLRCLQAVRWLIEHGFDSFVTIELVYDPAKGAIELGTGLNHLVVQVESLDTVLADLAARGIETEPPELPGGTDGPRTSWITDPDGYRIELVQWPVGHADGITEADFA
jgi:lactoylglutathione lyase